MKILVINRQKEVIGQIVSVLASVEPVIRYYDSGLDGLLAARIETFDLIICSTDLPVITGFELVRSLRHSSVNKGTPVIFLADELNHKTTYLSQILGAAATLKLNDQQLEEVLQSHRIKYEAKRPSSFQDIFPGYSLN
jgi:DNA-binding response OmpR family regulator